MPRTSLTGSLLAILFVATTLIVFGCLLVARAMAEHPTARSSPASMAAGPPPIHTTMPALHAHGGVPRGWKFLLPPGNAVDGRKVFIAEGCYKCHAVLGEAFPDAQKSSSDVGPDLSGMGSHHPAEYFAESIINPNRVIVDGPGYTGPDGRSRMPEYSDSLTIRQLVDLVAYLNSLKSGGESMGHRHGH